MQLEISAEGGRSHIDWPPSRYNRYRSTLTQGIENCRCIRIAARSAATASRKFSTSKTSRRRCAPNAAARWSVRSPRPASNSKAPAGTLTTTRRRVVRRVARQTQMRRRPAKKATRSRTQNWIQRPRQNPTTKPHQAASRAHQVPRRVPGQVLRRVPGQVPLPPPRPRARAKAKTRGGSRAPRVSVPASPALTNLAPAGLAPPYDAIR